LRLLRPGVRNFEQRVEDRASGPAGLFLDPLPSILCALFGRGPARGQAQRRGVHAVAQASGGRPVLEDAPAPPQATTAALLASANRVGVGQAVTFTATVRGPAGSGTPTGTVTFFVNGRVVARVTLDANGQARLPRSFSRTALFTIRAVYSG